MIEKFYLAISVRRQSNVSYLGLMLRGTFSVSRRKLRELITADGVG